MQRFLFTIEIGCAGGRENRRSVGPSPDWLINIKMHVLVKGTIYIYYGRYIDRAGGVIVSDCYSYSVGSHAAGHECAVSVLGQYNVSGRGVYAWGRWTGVLPSQ